MLFIQFSFYTLYSIHFFGRNMYRVWLYNSIYFSVTGPEVQYGLIVTHHQAHDYNSMSEYFVSTFAGDCPLLFYYFAGKHYL